MTAAAAAKAPQKAAPAKAPAEKKAPSVKRSKFAELYPDDAALKLLAPENPKKVGSKSHARFEFYTGSATVGAFREKGGTYQDIAYDLGRQFISVTPK